MYSIVDNNQLETAAAAASKSRQLIYSNFVCNAVSPSVNSWFCYARAHRSTLGVSVESFQICMCNKTWLFSHFYNQLYHTCMYFANTNIELGTLFNSNAQTVAHSNNEVLQHVHHRPYINYNPIYFTPFNNYYSPKITGFENTINYQDQSRMRKLKF